MLLKLSGARLLASLFILLALAACAREAPSDEVVTVPEPTAPEPARERTPPPVPSGNVRSQDLDGGRFGSASYADFRNYVESDRVYFDFDKSEIRSDARPTLQRMAEWLNHHDDVRFTIEGHADRRGTREYNLALGERRATAVRNYLIAQGITPSRIDVISYGKERLAAPGTTEQAHQLNRRGVVTFD
ncbi:MAG: peptidoglycan-associated lipoprotein Pal [Rhodothalassiaceae bacterium]